MLKRIISPKLSLRTCSIVNTKYASGAQGKRQLRNEVTIKNSKQKIWPNCPHRIYVTNDETVELIVKNVSDDLKNEKAFIFEASPGPGKLTKALLEAGAQRVRVFPIDQQFDSELQELEHQYPLNLEVSNDDLIKLNEIMFNDAANGTSVLPTLFSDVAVHSWDDLPSVKLIVPLSPMAENSFLRPLFTHFAHNSGIYTFGRSEVIAVISGHEHYYMSAAAEEKKLNRYRYASVLYQSLFDIEYLAEVSWDHFSPVITASPTKKPRPINVDMAYIVKLTPKKDFQKLNKSLWPDYVFFVQQAMTKRTGSVIHFFERWMPGCGKQLIKFGIPLFTRFGDLTPQEFFDLFREFTAWDDFKSSYLKSPSNIQHEAESALSESCDSNVT